MFGSKWMFGVSVVVAGFSTGVFALDCPNAFQKTIPFSKDIGSDNASVNLTASADLNYDCETFAAESFADATVGFFKINAQAINVKASTLNTSDKSDLNVRIMSLGYEVKSIKKDLTTVYEDNFKPSQDIDISRDLKVMIGPLPVTIRYGVEGLIGVKVKAGMRNFGSYLDTTPYFKTAAYLQGGIDVKIVKASARGDLLLGDGKMPSEFGVYFDRTAKNPSINYSVRGRALVDALEGSAKARVETNLGDDVKTYERDLFSWDAQTYSAELFNHSDKLFVIASH